MFRTLLTRPRPRVLPSAGPPPPFGRPTAAVVPVPVRGVHLAPQFLLDEYMPRYQLLTSRDAAMKRSRAYAHMRNCNLCPRKCGVNRFERAGMCLVGDKAKVNVIAPHFGEEACIQGHNGSGTVFMSGCNLRCIFCQNYDIAHQRNGMDLTPEELGDWYIKLQEVGRVHNINIVTPEHVVPQVALSILHAADRGLRIPIVYNTSSFDSLDSIRLMDGLVDIYLADFKVWKPESSRRLLKADDYAATARESVKAMHDQVGDLCFTADGLAKRGLLIRHLVMPGKEGEGAEIMRFLGRDVSPDCFVHVMEQYHPDAHVGKKRRGRAAANRSAGQRTEHSDGGGGGGKEEVRYADINRAVNDNELSFVRKAAVDAGLWRFNEVPEHASPFSM